MVMLQLPPFPYNSQAQKDNGNVTMCPLFPYNSPEQKDNDDVATAPLLL
jgi:hypothetical protein